MAAKQWYEGVVREVIFETPKIRRYKIEIPQLHHFDYEPGQFIHLELPLGEKRNFRAYSIASSYKDKNLIELIISYNGKGKGTGYIFEHFVPGFPVRISSALGKFVLPKKIEKEICFICTGVGISPFRSMYNYIIQNNIEHKGIKLIFGTRESEDICYYYELNSLDNANELFDYLPVLSRDDSGWQGKKGYVHDIYRELYSDGRDTDFYICGWKDMVKEARKNLNDMGYTRENIHIESYG
jgi:NAD(P)H-flavin reductase